MPTILRNTIAVIIGLAAALGIISFGITVNESWIPYNDYNLFPYEHWNRVINSAKFSDKKEEFFVPLLFPCELDAILDGLITPAFVKRAKKVYVALVGF